MENFPCEHSSNSARVAQLMTNSLFHPEKLFPRFVELVAVVLLGLALSLILTGQCTWLEAILISILGLNYLLMRFCATKRWYKDTKRGAGIERHFRAGKVVASYCLALGLGLFWLTQSWIPLALVLLPLAFFLHFYPPLIRMYLSDQDETQINYYSSGQFLQK